MRLPQKSTLWLLALWFINFVELDSRPPAPKANSILDKLKFQDVAFTGTLETGWQMGNSTAITTENVWPLGFMQILVAVDA